jgi:hypothetical protein
VPNTAVEAGARRGKDDRKQNELATLVYSIEKLYQIKGHPGSLFPSHMLYSIPPTYSSMSSDACFRSVDFSNSSRQETEAFTKE